MNIQALMNTGGMAAIESRVQQLETMIQQFDPPKPTQPFKSFLGLPENPVNNTPTVGSTKFSLEGLPNTLKARIEAFQPLVEKLSAEHGVDKNLVNAVIRQESGFNPAAVSHAGARGLMQLMPGTAKSLGVTDPHNPVQNLQGGIRLLKNLLKTYNGNIPLALAAYNAGGGAVAKYKGVPPYKETQNYVRNILGMYLQQKQVVS